METRPGTYGKKKKIIPNPIAIIITISICIGCWLLGFFESIGLPLNPGIHPTPLWSLLCSLIKNSEIGIYTGGFLLLFITSLAISRESYMLLILKDKTILPSLFFLILGSTNPAAFPIQASSIALLFLLVAFYELFHSYQHPVDVGRIFNATMYISLGSLFWAYLLWFIPLFWYGLYKFRLFSIRSIFASFLGFFTTFWFVLAWCVWKHDYSLLTIPLQSLANIDLYSLKEAFRIEGIFPFSIVMFIAISIYVILLREMNTLRTRQYFTFLLIFSIYSFLLIFIYEHDRANILSVFYIPASILLSYLFANRNGFISYLAYYGIIIFLTILFILRLWNF